MLKEKLKGFVAGFLVCATLSTAVLAAPIEKTIKVVYNNIKLYVDGTLIQPKDGKGNTVQPFIYNGTTYLPAAAISKALGKNVKWDGKTSTVYIGNYDGSVPLVWLDQLNFSSCKSSATSYGASLWERDQDYDFTGRTYNHGIKYTISHGTNNTWLYSEYLLNSKYSRLKGTFVLHYDSRNDTTATYLKIYGDDKLLHTLPELKAGVQPISFDVDVTGVEKLKFEITYSNDMAKDSHYYGLVDTKLY
ncbi:MAG: stalk domain-containing protein [Clostridia bacterium]|nr:stalk domain-containing protein [Clostridia bacterium]